MKYKSGFTLIELLVVITIIAILMGLLFPAINYGLLLARGTKTSAKLQDIQRNLSQASMDGADTVAGAIHSQLSALAPVGTALGVVTFKIDQRLGTNVPATGTWFTTPFPTWYFPHPWGQVPTDFPDNPPTSLPIPSDVLVIETHGLNDLTPDFSHELLEIAGCFADRDPNLYYTDRDPDKPWNDAWGYPLVVSMGMYQPRENTQIRSGAVTFRGSNETRQFNDLFLRRAQEAYGFTKSFYLTPAAIGPVLPTTVSDSEIASSSSTWIGPSGILQKLWEKITSEANAKSDGSQIWLSDGAASPALNPFTSPPWNGIKTIRGKKGAYTLLAAPIEVR